MGGKDGKTVKKRGKKYLTIWRGKRCKRMGAPNGGVINAYGAGERGFAWRDSTSELTEDSTLAEWFQSARLETRTKESNMCASRWVTNPRGASNLTVQKRPNTDLL